MSSDLTFKKAHISDLGLVLDILNEGIDKQIQNGLRIWNRDLKQRTLEGIQSDDTYLVYDASKAIGTFRLAWTDDNWSDDDLAGYVHKIATTKLASGDNTGKKILLMCAKLVIANKRRYIRLDVLSSNEKLKQYYLAMGFNYVTDGHAHKTSKFKTVCLYEIEAYSFIKQNHV